jgi:hypothetical protein
MARLEKRAGEEFPHVVGTRREGAGAQVGRRPMAEDDPTRKALEAILTSAEKMIAQGFAQLGGGGGQSPTQKAASRPSTARSPRSRSATSISEHAPP